jgi:hypothetical protein
MPKLVSELAQGNTFSRSSDGGALADSATRVFKIILNTPDEALDIFTAIGVNIGDVYSQTNPIPCVSIEGRADGESRLIRIVTAQYRSSAGVGASGGGGGGGGGSTDPKATAPDLRFASFSVSTSYMEMPQLGKTNAVGDVVDGLSRFEPVVIFNFKQFEQGPFSFVGNIDPTAKLTYVGSVNSNQGQFGSLDLFPRSTLFRACNIEQHVESWGGQLYRGYMVSYEFAFRNNRQEVWQPLLQNNGFELIGWDAAIPKTGFNVKAFQPVNADPEDDIYGQPLRMQGGRVVPPLLLPDGIEEGEVVRAMVRVMDYEEGGTSLTPSAQPVALNYGGRPRKRSANPPVIVERTEQHDDFDFSVLNLRLPPI